MVDLPSVRAAPALIQAPQSRVSAGEIRQLGMAQADAVNGMKTALEDVATPMVEDQARKDALAESHVTRGEDGSISIQAKPAPFLAGKLADVYKQTHAVAFQADLRNSTHTALQDLAAKTWLPVEQGGGGGDPDWFNKGADAYIKGVAGAQRGGMQSAALQEGSTIAGEYGRSIAQKRQAMDALAATKSVDGRMAQLEEDLSALAFNGAGNSDDARQKHAELDGLRATKSGDPRMGYAPDQALRDKQETDRGLQAQAIVGGARRDYQSDWNLQRVQQDAEQKLTALNLPAKDMLKYLGEINTHLKSTDAAVQQQRADLRAEADSVREVMKTGRLNEKMTNDLVDRLKGAHLYAKAFELEASRDTVMLGPIVRNGAIPAATAALNRSLGIAPPASGARVGGIPQSKWITPPEATQYASMEKQGGVPAGYLGGTARVESEGDGDHSSRSGSNVGRFQFNQGDVDTWLGPGYDVGNPQHQAMAAIEEAKHYGSVIRGLTGRDATAGELYLAHQQRGGFVKMLKNPDAPASGSAGSVEAITRNGGSANMTGRQFMEMWTQKFSNGSDAAPVAGQWAAVTAGRNLDTDTAFLKTRLVAGHDASHIDNMSPDLRQRVSAMFQAAPAEIREGLGIVSGARSNERQAELFADAVKKYGSEEEARKWVAPPGLSQHNKGGAADLGYQGKSLAHAPANVVKWVHDNADQFGLKFPLGNENWHVEVAETRGGGAGAPSRVNGDYLRPTVDPDRNVATYGAHPMFRSTVSQLQKDYDERGRILWAGMDKAWQDGKQPSQSEIEDLATMYPNLGDTDLQRKISERLKIEGVKESATGISTDQLADVVQGQQDRAARGGASALERKVADELAEQEKRRNETLAKNPADYSQRNLDPKATGLTLAPLDYSGSKAFQAGLEARGKAVELVRRVEPTAGANPLRAGEAATMAKLLTNAPGKDAGAYAELLATTMKPDQLVGALEAEGNALAIAIKGMTMSGDPQKITAGFAVMDRVDRDNPDKLTATFGEDSQKRLDVWNAKTAFRPVDQVVKEMMTHDDPSTKAARAKLEEEGVKKADTYTAANVAGLFKPHWWSSSSSMLPESMEPALEQGVMRQHFNRAFAAYYAEIGDEGQAATQAAKRIGQMWGASDANGGRLMRYPPESKVPPVNGSLSWVSDQLQADMQPVLASMGTKFQSQPFYGVDMPGDSRSETAPTLVLVADDKTRADIGRGTAPSYQIVAISNGEHVLVSDRDGTPHRWRPDHAAALSAATAKAVPINDVLKRRQQFDGMFQRSGSVSPAVYGSKGER